MCQPWSARCWVERASQMTEDGHLRRTLLEGGVHLPPGVAVRFLTAQEHAAFELRRSLQHRADHG